MDAWLVAFGVVFVAELGDKSQLLALAFTSRYRPWVVLAGIASAAALMLGVASLVGGVLGDRIPRDVVGVVAGLAFLVFAVWSLLGRDDVDDTADVARRGGGSAFVAVAGAFLVAEFGDKTMLATAALATSQPAVATWLGGTAGMVAADALAVALGAALATRLPARVLQLVSAALFAVVGVVLLIDALVG